MSIHPGARPTLITARRAARLLKAERALAVPADPSVRTPSPPDAPAPVARRVWYRLAFFLVATVLVGLVVALPFAFQSLMDDLRSSVRGKVFTLLRATPDSRQHERDNVHVSIAEIDEARLKVTLRVSAQRNCLGGCTTGTRIVLFSVSEDDAESAGMPPSAVVDLSPSQTVVSQSVDLPIRGHPTLYPWDVYHLWLGVGLAELGPDRLERPLSRADAADRLTVTLQEVLAREDVEPPVPIPPTTAEDSDAPYELQSLTILQFNRPLHERVLAVLLVVLIAAAAAYAVFMRPLHDLVINSGGLVIGVWGIRSLLSPGTASRTVVEVALSLVILFLLSAITFRALQFLYARGGWSRHGSPARPDS